jgi:hypothetical protein
LAWVIPASLAGGSNLLLDHLFDLPWDLPCLTARNKLLNLIVTLNRFKQTLLLNRRYSYGHGSKAMTCFVIVLWLFFSCLSVQNHHSTPDCHPSLPADWLWRNPGGDWGEFHKSTRWCCAAGLVW